ncbi:MAG TPA: MarR family transcriptional regulator [Pyrinomonadaceae bacterium]|nr:MarR family transcriptional regulator [Pyrinomonadaceae bacterium]
MGSTEHVVFYQLEKAIKTYRQFAQRRIRAAGYSITIDQWLTMKTILENPGLKQQELAERVFKDEASITRIIEILVRERYLTRKIPNEDRRRTVLEVTVAGKEILEKVGEVILRNREDALSGVETVDLEALDGMLRKIIENCRLPIAAGKGGK